MGGLVFTRRRKSGNQGSSGEDATGTEVVLLPLAIGEPGAYLPVLKPADRRGRARDLAPLASLAAGIIDSAGAYNAAQSVIRFAPETSNLINQGIRPLTQGGYNLGVLAKEGKIVAQVKWLQGAGATATTVSMVANLSTAVALASIQVQLASMQKQLASIDRTTRDIKLIELNKARGVVRGAEHNVRRLTKRLTDHGPLDATELTSLDNSRQALHDSAGLLRDLITTSIDRLGDARSVSTRQQFLKEDSQDLILNIEALLKAEQYELYATGLLDLHRAHTVAQFEALLATAQDQLALHHSQTQELLTRAHRITHLITIDPGTRSLKQHLPRSKAAQTVRSQFAPIAAYLQAASGDSPTTSAPPSERLLVLDSVNGARRDDAWTVIAYTLMPGETLEFAAVGEHDMLVLTDQRLFCIDGTHHSILPWELHRHEVQSVDLIHHDSWTAPITDNDRSIHLKVVTSRRHPSAYRFNFGDGSDTLAFAHTVHEGLARVLGGSPQAIAAAATATPSESWQAGGT